MTREEKATLWSRRISAYRASNLSAAQWCSMHELSLATLRYWIGRKNHQHPLQQKTEVKWLLLDGTSSAETVGGNDEIRIQVGKALVSVGCNFSEEALLRVIKVLHAYA